MSLLGNRLRQARKGKGFTQDYVAKIIDSTYQTVSNYERGERDPDTDTLARLSNLFEVSIDWLVGQTDDPTPPQARQEQPSHEEYVLSVKTLGDAAIRIAELLSQDLIDGKEYLRLNELAVKKFPLRPAKGASKAAHLEVNIPGTGVFKDKASEK